MKFLDQVKLENKAVAGKREEKKNPPWVLRGSYRTDFYDSCAHLRGAISRNSPPAHWTSPPLVPS